jgi:hypothetical protein
MTDRIAVDWIGCSCDVRLHNFTPHSGKTLRGRPACAASDKTSVLRLGIEAHVLTLRPVRNSRVDIAARLKIIYGYSAQRRSAASDRRLG